MDYDAVVEQVIALLQREQRLSYRVLKRRLQLDDELLEDLKEDLIYAKQLAVDEEGKVLVWAGGAGAGATPAAPAAEPARPPRSYTPLYLVEKILTSKTALEGERKQVTVLFADLKGSMELVAERDPEEARALLDPVLERMIAAVHRYEGMVNQVMGDGIMALFGAPIAHEDHAVRACYAALAMKEAIQSYSEEARRVHGITVQIRVGLNSGEVVVRAIGNDLHMDYTAVGQTTHLAARMEQLAMSGSMLLTLETLRLAEGFIQVKALGPVPVKGVAEPVEVFELVGASAIRRRLYAAAIRGLTRFVGREAELTGLAHALAEAGTGHGQVVALVGEAGVGKSRLVYECLHSHRTQGWVVLESASVSYGKATPYFPVLDLLKRYMHVEDCDDSRTIRAKVTGQVLTLDEALQETIPALLGLLEALPEDSPYLRLDPSQRRQGTLDALKRLLLCESQVQPVLLVFEDLHWIDSETQALLDSLVESLPTAKILLLVNYRPEYQHGWGSKTYYTQLRLDPLPPASAEELLQALLGDDPRLAPLTRLLIAQTEGNPFFLTAAVIGNEVPLPLLQAIAELPDDPLHRGLAHLQAAEFLYETRLFPEREYTFKHALTHEVAYGSLVHERRRALHAHIVEAIEELYPDRVVEQVERLAHHALRGEVWEKALTHYRQAGAKAFGRSANREAVTCFEQALVALRHLSESRDTIEQAIDIRFDLRNPLWLLGDLVRVFEYMHEAESLAEILDDQPRLGWISAYMSNSFLWMGEYDRALESGLRALAIAETAGDFALQVTTDFFLGMIYHSLGHYRRALDFLERTVASLQGDRIRERFGLPVLLSVVSRTWSVWCLAECGMFGEGITRGEEGIRIAEAVDQPSTLIFAYMGLGHLYLRQGDLHRAISVLECGLRLCQVGTIRRLFPQVASPLGFAYILSGRVTEALPLLEQAVDEATSISMVGHQSLWVAYLSAAYLLAGRIEEAALLAQRALDLSKEHQERGHQAYALRLLGAIAARREPPEHDQAEAHYQQALALAEALGMRPLVAHCHLGLGTLYAQIGRSEQAHTELTTAIELYRAMAMTFWLPQAEAALAQVEGR